MMLQNIVVASSAGILFLYFFLEPRTHIITHLIILGMWAGSMAWDLRFTLVHESHIQRYEKSIILSLVYGRMPKGAAAGITVVIESSCVVLLPLVVGSGSSAILAVAYFFALLHAVAIFSNDQFVKKNQSQ